MGTFVIQTAHDGHWCVSCEGVDATYLAAMIWVRLGLHPFDGGQMCKGNKNSNAEEESCQAPHGCVMRETRRNAAAQMFKVVREAHVLGWTQRVSNSTIGGIIPRIAFIDGLPNFNTVPDDFPDSDQKMVSFLLHIHPKP